MTTQAENTGQSEAAKLAACIQHTIISNALTTPQWEAHVTDCLRYGFHAAMVPPAWVAWTAQTLRGSRVRTASFVDFPLGTMTSVGKAFETVRLVEAGAQEVDLMPNVGFLLSGMEKEYFEDIRGVVAAAGDVPVKIMLELPLLNETQKKRAVELSVEAGATYLKNASGGAVGAATPEQIRFLRELAPARVHIKASGGIKSAKIVRELLAAGAELVGTSSGVAIIREVLGMESGGEGRGAAY